jgi:hypothetical protein
MLPHLVRRWVVRSALTPSKVSRKQVQRQARCRIAKAVYTPVSMKVLLTAGIGTQARHRMKIPLPGCAQRLTNAPVHAA